MQLPERKARQFFSSTSIRRERKELLQLSDTAADSGLRDGSNISILKGEAADWQHVVVSEPKLFEPLGDFMALSAWRDEGGYEQAGITMSAKVAEWESSASGLS